MTIPLVDIKGQYRRIKTEVDQAIADVLESGQFILGPVVQDLENKLAEYCGAAYAVGVASGTDAILLALKALGIGPGDDVVLPPFTFFATAGAVHNVGARPVFCDIDPSTYNIDPEKVRDALTPDTKAIIPVHLFGQCAALDALSEIAREHKCVIIEDAAQAIGAEYRGQKAGTLGAAGCFSFFPTKNLGGYGDGGMVVTNQEHVAQRVRKLRVHGESERYFHDEIGLNSRLDALQATIIRAKLNHLQHWNQLRRAHARRYTEHFARTAIVTPFELEGTLSIYNQYTIRVPEREKVQEALSNKGIGWAIYYPLPLHLQECFRFLDYAEGDFPEAEKAAKEVISLPVYPELTQEDQDLIIQTVLEAVTT